MLMATKCEKRFLKAIQQTCVAWFWNCTPVYVLRINIGINDATTYNVSRDIICFSVLAVLGTGECKNILRKLRR